MFEIQTARSVPATDVFTELAKRRVVFVGEGNYSCPVTARGVGDVLDGFMQTNPEHRDLCLELPEAYADMLCDMETRYGVTPHAVDFCPIDEKAMGAALSDLLSGRGAAAMERVLDDRLSVQPDIAANIKTVTEGRPALVLFGAAYLGEDGLPAQFSQRERGVIAVFRSLADFQAYADGERLCSLPRLTPVLDYLYLAKERCWLKSQPAQS